MSDPRTNTPEPPAADAADAADNPYVYVGEELDLFAEARRWKSYFRRHLRPFLTGRVLEVGAGTGGTTKLLCTGREPQWVCLEPDPRLAERLQAQVTAGRLPGNCEVVVGTVEDVAEQRFDTIIYIDVLEHIEDDRGEVARAARVLAPGGHLVALSPAHQWLFSPFDESIGHFRRYTRRGFGGLADPATLEQVKLVYLDSVGLLASAGNRFLLKSGMPNSRQIALWDRAMVPLSRLLDPLTFHRLGKSVVSVWRKIGPAA